MAAVPSPIAVKLTAGDQGGGRGGPRPRCSSSPLPRPDTERPHDHSTTGGPSLPQERRLVTEIPGPRVAALLARKEARRRRRGHTLPVFVDRAGGGVSSTSTATS